MFLFYLHIVSVLYLLLSDAWRIGISFRFVFLFFLFVFCSFLFLFIHSLIPGAPTDTVAATVIVVPMLSIHPAGKYSKWCTLCAAHTTPQSRMLHTLFHCFAYFSFQKPLSGTIHTPLALAPLSSSANSGSLARLPGFHLLSSVSASDPPFACCQK